MNLPDPTYSHTTDGAHKDSTAFDGNIPGVNSSHLGSIRVAFAAQILSHVAFTFAVAFQNAWVTPIALFCPQLLIQSLDFVTSSWALPAQLPQM